MLIDKVILVTGGTGLFGLTSRHGYRGFRHRARKYRLTLFRETQAYGQWP